MRIKLLTSITFTVLLLFQGKEKEGYRYINNTSFKTGERLEYRVHLGFLSGAYATMEVSDKIYYVNGRPCYKVNIFGKTAGMIDLFYKVRDNWGSYIDTSAIVPQRFYRYIRENKYRKNEIVNFDHQSDTALVSRLDKETLKLKEKVKFAVNDNIQDLVSGAYYLRTMDLDNKKKGDIIEIKGFFDDEIYDLKVQYLGVENLDTKVGDFDAHVMVPIMPENDLFDGENSIKLWISKDKNKIPLKIRAEMFIGAIEVDIKSYKNLRN